MPNIKSIIITLTLAICHMSFAVAQEDMITGKVLDAGGEALIGVHVKWKDQKVGTVTDIEGNFTLSAPKARATLSVSYIGYKTQEVDVEKGQRMVSITLIDDAQSLDELVVVGYGIQKKSSITGSVETIKAEDLLMMPTMNIDQALTAQVAGLQVMQSTGDPSSAKESAIRIRGINDAPLLVIDGVPRFGTTTSDGEMRLSDLNPDDIESVTILKDAASAAVYGARAANGVILVQTKKGKDGGKVNINYRGQYNLQQATQMPDFLDAYDFALLFNKAVENTPGTTVVPYTPEQLEMIRTNAAPNIYANEDYLSYLNNTGWSTTHSVSVSGGNKAVRYYLSTGYADSKGLYSGIGRNRLNYMGKIDAELGKGLTLSFAANGSHTKAQNSSYYTIDNAYAFSPLQVVRFENGDLASIDGSNPLIAIEGLGGYMKNKSKMNTVTANLNWEVPFVKGLSMYIRGTFDDNLRIETTFDKPVTLYTYDNTTGTYAVDVNTVYPTAKVSLEQDDHFFDSQLYEAGMNYMRTFNEKHDVEGTVVTNYQRTHTQYMYGTNLDKSIYPEVLGSAQTAELYGDEMYNQRASLIGRAKYGYDNRYFAEFSFRVDGSNNFHPDHRWGFFPSFATAWAISNEPFFKNWEQDVLSNAKLRFSTGWLGNDGLVGAYSYLKTYTETTNYGYNIGGNFRPGLYMSSNPNINLTWGRTHDYNMATDLGFWRGRIGLTFEYFLRYETDKITSAPDYLYPPTTGVDGNIPSQNFSKLKTWGWDLTLTHRNTIGKLKYNVGIILSKSDDEYLDFGDESAQLPNLRRKGRSSLVWTMYEADGLFQSQEEISKYGVDQDGQNNATIAPGDIKYVDKNGDKKIDANDRIYVKNSSHPDMDLGLKLNVSYNGFFINALFQGEYGYKQDLNEYYTLENSTLQKFQRYHLYETWTPENPNARYPRIKFATTNDNNRRASTFWIQDCNFIRLKSLNVGYQFPKKWIQRLDISSASIAFQASNIFTISNLKNMDPESLRGYPVQKSYGATLNLTF
ncbi:MAG: TonB-dependent receptor [Bacteroidaceae bacterium]|nr:TonB-dependent receptor [Bacteroidaceae bacterium]